MSNKTKVIKMGAAQVTPQNFEAQLRFAMTGIEKQLRKTKSFPAVIIATTIEDPTITQITLPHVNVEQKIALLHFALDGQYAQSEIKPEKL